MSKVVGTAGGSCLLAGIRVVEVALFQCYVTIYLYDRRRTLRVGVYESPGCLFCFQPHKSLEFRAVYLVCF